MPGSFGFPTNIPDSSGVVAGSDLATQSELNDHLNDTTAAHAASAISVTTNTTTLSSTTVQDALAELDDDMRVVQVKVFDDATPVSTGDGKVVFVIPPEFNGLNVVDFDTYVTTSSTITATLVTTQLRNITNANVDVLSTKSTIDANEYTSYTAATAAVINAANDNVATGDRLAIDVDAAPDSPAQAKGLGAVIKFG